MVVDARPPTERLGEVGVVGDGRGMDDVDIGGIWWS